MLEKWRATKPARKLLPNKEDEVSDNEDHKCWTILLQILQIVVAPNNFTPIPDILSLMYFLSLRLFH